MTKGQIEDAAVEDLPPSARYVLEVVEQDGPIRRQDLIDETYYAERTISDQLKTLENRGLIFRSRDPDNLRHTRVDVAPM